MNKMRCKVCGTYFPIMRAEVYRVSGQRYTEAYDAMDCPACGCQRILAERLPTVEEAEKRKVIHP